MRMDQADYARDAKKENSMCAMASCMANPYEHAPKGWGSGRYGGTMLCKKHYQEVVDDLTRSIIEGNDPPWSNDE